MQKTFQLLRRGDIEGVRQILDKKPEEVNAVSGDKPKRDQGQSLLQVAIKSGHLDIADLLIDRGAAESILSTSPPNSGWTSCI